MSLGGIFWRYTAEVVCGRKRVRKEKRTTWWSKEIEVAVKSKKEA